MLNSIQFELTIETQKETDVFVLPAEVYKKIMAESAPLANFTNELLSSRFTEVMWLLDQILWKSFDKRLAGFLLEESAIQDTQTLKITHEEIGNHLGNPREVVTRMLKYFSREGMVELARGTIRLTDVKNSGIYKRRPPSGLYPERRYFYCLFLPPTFPALSGPKPKLPPELNSFQTP